MTDLTRPRRAPILDGRLSAAMALAGKVKAFADIGADHGRLSAVMLRSGAAHALIADVSAAALSKAQKRIHSLGLEEKATFAVADGLMALDNVPDMRFDAVFVLGMGGDTVSGILLRGFERLHGAALILGAQTELPMVRDALCAIGYRIRKEQIASEGGRDYVLMRAEPALEGERSYTEEERLLGPGLLAEKPLSWLPLLERRRRLLTNGITAMRASQHNKDAQRLALFERELVYTERALNALYAKEGEKP